MKLSRKILLFAFIVLPVLFIAVYSYWRIKKDTVARIYEDRRSLVSLSAHVLKEKLDRLNDIGLSFSTRPLLCKNVDEKKWDDAIGLMKLVSKDFPYIDRVFITDIAGTLMADMPSSPALKGKNYAQRDWFKGLTKNWQPYLSEVYKRNDLARNIVTSFALPVKNDAGKFRGILVLQVNVAELLEWSKKVSIGKSGFFIYVIDQKGNIVVNPQYTENDSVIDYSSVPAIQKALSGKKNVEVLYNPIAKENRLSAYEKIPGYGWAVIVQQEAAAALSGNGDLQFIFTFYVAIIITTAISAYFIIREMDRRKKVEEKLLAVNKELEANIGKLAESEEKLSILFNSIDEGFCIIEMIFDEQKKPVDYRFLMINASFERQTGLHDAVGKRMRELAPNHEEHWFETYGRIALTGESIRFENRAEQLHRWYDVYAFRLGEPKNLQVGILFNDITGRKQAEETLQNTLKEVSDYKYALDESSIMAITDQGGIIRQVNDNFCKISKYKREELIGQDHRIMNSGFHPKEFIRDMWETISNGKVWHAEVKNKAKDGSYFWLDTTIVPFMNEQGNPYQYVAIRSDITKRKILENEINQFNSELQKRVEEKTKEVIEKEQQYRFLLQNMREGIQVIGHDWRYIFVNNSVVKQSKYSGEELLGHTMMEKYPGIENTETFKVLNRCMKDRIPQVTENEFIFPDGTNEWYELSIQPVPEGLFILSMDITERKKADNALLNSLKEISDYKYAINESSIVAFTDQKGIISHVNDNFCEISKYSKEELIGQDHRIINSGFHPKEFIRNLWVTIANGKIWRGELRNKAKDGSFYWVDTTIVPFLNKNGKPFQYVAIRSDITKRKEAEQELLKLNQALEKRTTDLQNSNTELERFAYVASHDLQEPLRMVSSFLNLLEEEMDGQLNETSKEYIHFAVDGTDRMKTLIQALLQFSRIGINKEDFATTDLNEVLQFTIRVLEENIVKSQAVITVNPMPVITANKTLIGQLFKNLLSNSLKYHGGKIPEIEVGFTEEPDKYIFYVKDNGIGIDSKFFDKIFIIFQRLHNRTEYSGTGIGLAICKKIVETYRGKIWVESEPGLGSTFYFSIPKNNNI